MTLFDDLLCDRQSVAEFKFVSDAARFRAAKQEKFIQRVYGWLPATFYAVPRQDQPENP